MQGLSKFNTRLAALSLAGILAWSCGPQAPLQMHDYHGGALGTSYAITVFTTGQEDLAPAIDSVFAVVNHSLSTYQQDSDISRINNGDSTVVVDALFREVFEASDRIFHATNGYFDPTVGVLVDAWGFGPGAALEMDSTVVDSLLRYVGFEKLKLGADNRLQKSLPAIRLDFNAIAKGYAIDCLGRMLEARGIDHYLVEVGGEVRTRGDQPEKKRAWHVGIDDPQATEGRAIKRIVALQDVSMASSGNYRKFRVDSETGEKFVHTVDPHTGFTRNSNVLATSVIAPDCTTADGYATAFMAMDLEASQALLADNPDLEGYIVYLNEQGETEEFATPGFEALFR